MRHSEADGQNQNDVGRGIHSERSGRTSGGNGHLNLGTPHPDDTINQGYCRTSPTYLKTNLLKWRTLAVSTAVKHNGRGRSQRQPQKDHAVAKGKEIEEGEDKGSLHRRLLWAKCVCVSALRESAR